MLEIKLKYRVPIKRSYHYIDLVLIFQKYLVICNESIQAFNSVY